MNVKVKFKNNNNQVDIHRGQWIVYPPEIMHSGLQIFRIELYGDFVIFPGQYLLLFSYGEMHEVLVTNISARKRIINDGYIEVKTEHYLAPVGATISIVEPTSKQAQGIATRVKEYTF